MAAEKHEQGFFQGHSGGAEQPSSRCVIPRGLGVLHSPLNSHCEEHWEFLSYGMHLSSSRYRAR